MSLLVSANEGETPLAAQRSDVYLVTPPRQGALVERREPTPFYQLPYYQGFMHKAQAEKKLPNVGDFLLRRDPVDQQLVLSFRATEMHGEDHRTASERAACLIHRNGVPQCANNTILLNHVEAGSTSTSCPDHQLLNFPDHHAFGVILVHCLVEQTNGRYILPATTSAEGEKVDQFAYSVEEYINYFIEYGIPLNLVRASLKHGVSK